MKSTPYVESVFFTSPRSEQTSFSLLTTSDHHTANHNHLIYRIFFSGAFDRNAEHTQNGLRKRKNARIVASPIPKDQLRGTTPMSNGCGSSGFGQFLSCQNRIDTYHVREADNKRRTGRWRGSGRCDVLGRSSERSENGQGEKCPMAGSREV